MNIESKRPDRPARRLKALGGRRLGPHLPLKAGLSKAAERARVVGATAIQVFADNPTTWRRKPEPPSDSDAFRARLAQLDIGPVAIHASYLINLCGADPVFWERSIEALAAELRMGVHYGARMVNVHIGSHRGLGRAAGIARLAAGISEVLARTGDAPELPHVVLENSAGAGDGVGSTVEDLADIAKALARSGLGSDRVGFCLDTAHLWGAGYAIDERDELDVLLRRMDVEVGTEWLRMIHLNDSSAGRGSSRDRHEHIGAGAIGPAGMRAVLEHPRLAHLPFYLETPGMDTGFDKVNMDRVRALIAGRDLPRLPARAFDRRGAGRQRQVRAAHDPLRIRGTSVRTPPDQTTP